MPEMEIVRKQRRVAASSHEMLMTKSFIFAMKCHPLTLQKQIFGGGGGSLEVLTTSNILPRQASVPHTPTHRYP